MDRCAPPPRRGGRRWGVGEAPRLVALAVLVVASGGGAGGGADATAFRPQHGGRAVPQAGAAGAGAGLRLRGGTGDLKHLLPDEDSSDSGGVDYAALTAEEKKEHEDRLEMEQFEMEFMQNYTLTDQRGPSSAAHAAQMQNLLREARALKRAQRRRKTALLRDNRGAQAVFEDENGALRTLIDEMDPGMTIPRDELGDGDSSESAPLPDPRDRAATLEYMFAKLLKLQRRNEDEERFDNHAEEDRIKGDSSPLATLLKKDELFAREKLHCDHVVDAPFVDEDGYTYNISGTPQEFRAQHGIFELPVTTDADFAKAEAEAAAAPTAPSALEAWEMFKGKDLEGFDTICLRHKKWGTEVELFIGSHGKFKTRPSPLHQVTTVEVDGTWFEWVANYEEMDAPHIFDFLWERSGGPAPGEESRMPSWDKGQYCWEEAMGGADEYLYNGREPCVPSGARAVDVEALSSEAGWVPCQDRCGGWVGG